MLSNNKAKYENDSLYDTVVDVTGLGKTLFGHVNILHKIIINGAVVQYKWCVVYLDFLFYRNQGVLLLFNILFFEF